MYILGYVLRLCNTDALVHENEKQDSSQIPKIFHSGIPRESVYCRGRSVY